LRIPKQVFNGVIEILAVPGLHRFAMGHADYGLLLIGTLTHIIKDKDVAFTYNRQVAAYHPQPTQKKSNLFADRLTFGYV
jgi:hypothetical protein